MVISFVRRITLPNGDFGGVVLISIGINHLAEMFQWSSLGANGAVVLYNADHVMMMRYPMPIDGVIGSAVITDHTKQMIDSDTAESTYETISPVDEMRKLISFRKIRNYPLYAAVTNAENDYLNQWRGDAANIVLFAVAFFVLSTFATWQMALRITERDKVQNDLKDSFDRYDRLVANIPWGVYTFRMSQNGDMRFDYVSHRFCQILCVTAQALLSDVSVAMGLVHPDELDEFLEMNAQSSQSLKPFFWKGRFVIDGQIRIIQLESTPTPLSEGVSLWSGVLADVTEQELAEQRLREMDAKLRGLYELSPLGIALTSKEGRFVEFNEAFRIITGYPENQLKELDFWTLTPDKYNADEMRQSESLERSGSYGPYRKEYISRDGMLIPVQLNGVRITGADGESYVWSIVENITDRLRAEEEQRLSLERFRLMTGGIKDHAIILLDADGKVLTWNDGAKRLMGYADAEIIGCSMDIFYDQDEVKAEKPRSLLTRSIANDVAEEEGWLLRQDRTSFWADMSVSCLHSEDGLVVGFVTIIRDITERKLAEDNLRLTVAVFEKSLQGIMVTDSSRSIVEVNDAFVKMTGYSRQESLGRDPSFLKSGHHDEAFYASMWRTIDQTGHWIGEIWNRRKNGDNYPELLSISAITNAKGEVTNYLGIATDQSRLKNQERQLEQIAHYDKLTGMANRTLLADRMDRALATAKRDGSLVGICYLDLDGFNPDFPYDPRFP